MKRWQEIADAIKELSDDGEIEIFVGEHPVGFDVGSDDEGVYITLCSDCLGEAIEVALGAAQETVPLQRQLH
ncbi:MAG: hypothetical protein JSW21_02850 [Gammaproteobacteria bacterium]|nr:MAG: hypothetical protein JSW21_02850 [Gammaproteobacteria bacterium]